MNVPVDEGHCVSSVGMLKETADLLGHIRFLFQSNFPHCFHGQFVTEALKDVHGSRGVQTPSLCLLCGAAL